MVMNYIYRYIARFFILRYINRNVAYLIVYVFVIPVSHADIIRWLQANNLNKIKLSLITSNFELNVLAI